ncbi:LPS translocon maturation chaperone LptM [Budvicia diplopodorum]|uniref:LPS translocon maturation chaperone LptM n=1 Tax=Budvicia diplopodorum TaxID=1119056 RepID=UPI001FEAFEE2|nr:lipoprotein [Budvicia diplopodorum]
MNKKFRCSLLVLTTLWLAGCGLKGPLYMPTDEPPKKEKKVESVKPAQTESNAQAESDAAK